MCDCMQGSFRPPCSPLKCSDALCELCMDGAGLLTRDRCTKCVQSSGSAGTADFYSVYRRANSTCSLVSFS